MFDNSTTPLTLRPQHLYALIYLLFGIMTAFNVSRNNVVYGVYVVSAKAYVCSGVFVALWGVLQYFCYHLNISYPYFVFNNSATPSATGYTSEIGELGVKRLSSVAVEPSMLAQTLLTVLPLVVVALILRKPIISRRCDSVIFVLFVVILSLTTSSTAYLGLLTMLLMVPFALRRIGWLSRRSTIRMLVVSVGGLCAAIWGAYILSDVVRGIVDNAVFTKASSYSAAERLRTILFAAEYFSNYPFLGIGWGSVTSHDLVFKLLANVGSVGLIAFIAAISSIVWRLFVTVKKAQDTAIPALSVMMSVVILVVTNLATGFAYVFGHFWFILGLAIALGSDKEKIDVIRLPHVAARGD